MNIFHRCGEETVLQMTVGLEWDMAMRMILEAFFQILSITFSTFVLALLNNFGNKNTIFDFF